MLTRNFNPTTAAFNVERVRAQMLEGVLLPKDLLQKAVDKAYEKLDAKKTQFFPFQGKIRDKVDVEDHQTQLAAADKIFAMAGVYARERDPAPSALQVALEIDPKTGIVRLIVGSIETSLSTVAVAPQVLEVPLAPSPGALAQNASPVEQFEREPEVIRVRQGNLSPKVFSALFGERDT